MAYTVAQNTSFLTAASVIQKVISFAYFTLIARLIGVGDTGSYFFAIAFTTIFTVVADFGLSAVLTREVARIPEKVHSYMNTVIISKLVFGVAAYGLAVAAVYLLNYSDTIKQLVLLSGVTMFFDNLHSGFYGVLRAYRNLKYESVGIIASQLITLVIGSVALFLHWPMIWLIAAYTIPSFLNIIYSAWCAKRMAGWQWKWSFDKIVFASFFTMAVPFAVTGILGRLYSYSDSILMSKLLSPEELGWWSVPYKITFAFQFIPSALAASVYPALSALYPKDEKAMGELFVKSYRYLFLIVLPLAFGLGALARPIITHLFRPEYLPAVPVLQVLLISLVFGFLTMITGSLLNAVNRQSVQTGLVGAGLVCNLGMNLFLLPRLGIMGAAFSALTSNLVIFVGGLIAASQSVTLPKRELLNAFVRTLLPAGIMGVVVGVLNMSNVHYLILIPLGAVVYAALLFVFGAVNMAMLREWKNKVMPIKT